ncbi:MAG: hypothetical protein IPO51_01305 [Dehalococcoidia bacterium]|nr:hypothetical protein [Dehalococcoidia bacterium]
MRILSLFFPRLGVQILRATRPELAGHPVGLLAGEGDGALLAAASVEATADGVEPGMTALQARQRCPGISFERDNARECLERLEAVASILRTRATPDVAIVSRNSVAVSLDGLEGRFADEAAAAQALLVLARSWSGLDVRAAVASTVEEAECAARTARRFPVIREYRPAAGTMLPRREPVTVSVTWETPATAAAARLRLGNGLASLQPALDAYEQSFRAVRVEVERGACRSAFIARTSQPIHRIAEVLDLLRGRVEGGALDGVTALRVTLEQPGPSVSVAPWRAAVATMHQLAAPAVPVQRRLLRAS